jgi:hypothetical protein
VNQLNIPRRFFGIGRSERDTRTQYGLPRLITRNIDGTQVRGAFIKLWNGLTEQARS